MKSLPILLCASLVSTSLLAACGGSQERSVKTQEERLAEQLALGEQQKKKSDESLDRFDAAETDSEKGEKFNEAAAEHELKRATLNAVECPDAIPESDLKGYQPGTAEVTVTFENDGDISDVTVAAPYADTPVGQCVVRAFKSGHIPQYVGEKVQKPWKVELAARKAAPAAAPKKK